MILEIHKSQLVFFTVLLIDSSGSYAYNNLVLKLYLGMQKIILLGFFNMGGMKKLWKQLKQVRDEVNFLMR